MAASATNGVNGASHAKLDFTTFSNVIDGKLTTTKETRHNINPATRQPNAEVPVATQEDVEAAVKAGKAAFKTWSKTTHEERAKACKGFAAGLGEYKSEFASLLTKEQGKPIQFASSEVDACIAWLNGLSTFQVADEVTDENEERQVIVRYTPLGLCVGIVPWNFPMHLAIGKIAPAVLTGNTIIIKPSPFTPYCDLKMVELAQQYFPPGVVQVLSGNDSLGPWLTAHPDVDKISFTGSTFTGKKVMESAAKSLKRVTLELGGNDPAIVCADVDIEKTAQKIATLAFMNSGQICLALKRIYIHESIYDKFRDAAVEFTKGLKYGEGNEQGVFLGPIQNQMQFDRVSGFFQDIEKSGQKVAVGGSVDGSKGYFVQPTIIDKPAEDSRIVVEEPFGPIVPFLSWSTEDDVIARANDTKMGLGASVWTKDLEQGRRIAKQLQAGSVWVNTHLEVSPFAPFGGHKESGIGHEWGMSGLKSFCNVQSMFVKKEI